MPEERRSADRRVRSCSTTLSPISLVLSALAMTALALSALALTAHVANAEPTEAVIAPTPANTSAPTISGTPATGSTLTCSIGSWSGNPNAFAYAWLRDGVPIAGQTTGSYVVQQADAGHRLSCRVTATNSGGEYTISALETGSYKVSFSTENESSAGNYLLQFFNGKPSSTAADPVSVTAPNTTSGVDVSLSAGGAIAGKVTAAAGGAPLGEVLVCAESESSGSCAETNASGEYTVGSLATGSYSVVFFGEEEYAPQYYSGKLTFKEGTPVAVTSGSTTTGIDVALQTGGQIAGIVSDKGTPIAGAFVCAGNEAEEEFGGCDETNAKGEYAVVGLAPGNYSLEFCLFDTCKNGYLEAAASKISVPAGALAHHNQELTKGGKIVGEVKDAVGAKQPIANISVCANPAHGGVDRCELTDANGKYAIAGLSGEYTVSFNGKECGGATCPVQNFAYTTYNSGAVVTVAAGEEKLLGLESMKVGGSIKGRVTDASDNASLTGVEVCDTGPSYDCADTNGAGEYTLEGLPTGTYEVGFYPEKTSNHLRSKVSGVKVTEGAEVAEVNGQLAVGGQLTGRVVAAAGGAGIANVEVCAVGPSRGCVESNAAGGSASASSAAVVVGAAPSLQFTIEQVKFDSKTDDLDFFFEFSTVGKLSWSLFFRNADVGFADSLGISLGRGEVAEVAREKAKGPKRCKKTQTRHKGRCVATLVSFGHGSQNVEAGVLVEVKVHAAAKAVKALKAGRTLHVSGTLTFQSALGGPSVRKVESAVVRVPRHTKKHRKGKRR